MTKLSVVFWALQVNITVFWLSHDCFLLYPFQFIIHWLSYHSEEPGQHIQYSNYTLDKTQQGRKMSVFSKTFRPALGPNQAPVQWVLGVLFQRWSGQDVKPTTHLSLVPRLRMSGDVYLHSLYIPSLCLFLSSVLPFNTIQSVVLTVSLSKQ